MSFSCSLHIFITCRSLYTFMGSSINPFMLMNLIRCCSASKSIGGMTANCRICFSVFWGTDKPHKETRILEWLGWSRKRTYLTTWCVFWTAQYEACWGNKHCFDMRKSSNDERNFNVSSWLSGLQHVACQMSPPLKAQIFPVRCFLTSGKETTLMPCWAELRK